MNPGRRGEFDRADMRSASYLGSILFQQRARGVKKSAEYVFLFKRARARSKKKVTFWKERSRWVKTKTKERARGVKEKWISKILKVNCVIKFAGFPGPKPTSKYTICRLWGPDANGRKKSAGYGARLKIKEHLHVCYFFFVLPGQIYFKFTCFLFCRGRFISNLLMFLFCRGRFIGAASWELRAARRHAGSCELEAVSSGSSVGIMTGRAGSKSAPRHRPRAKVYLQ